MMIAAQDYSQHSLPSSEPPSPSMSRSRLHTQSGQQPVIPQLQKIVKENPLCLDMIQKNLSNLQWSADDDQMVFTSLSLPRMALTKIDILKSFKYIQTLELSDNALEDVSALSSMPCLVRLDLSGNRLNKVPVFHPTPYSLEELDLSRNQISTISDLSCHKYLRSLCMDRNLIMKITGLDQCKRLTCLSLRNNGVSRIENLDGLPIKVLDLKQNRIRTVEGLSGLEELEEVYLANNYISSLEGLQDHRFLQTIDLEANDLTSVEEIQHLDQLTSLRNLNLRKNPIEGQSHIAFPPQAPNASDYTPLQLTQYLIIYLLPCIAIYNGIPVPPEEKVRASNIYQPPMVVTDAILHTQDVMRKLRSYVRIQASDLALSKRFRPIVLAGPAGSGKRTLTQRLLSDFPHLFGLCVSHTTRKPRPGEENGVHYHFVTKADMQAMNEDGQFVEVVSFFGNWYGNSFHSIYKVAMEGKICIMDLEMEGVLALKRSAINPRYVYITAPSVEVLQERLEQKAESQKQAMKEAKDRERELAEVERRARHQQFAEAFAAARRNGSVNLKHADSRFLDSAASGESEQPKSTESLFKRPTSSWRQERASDLLAAHAEAKQQHNQPFGGGQQSEKSNNVESDVEVDTDALVSKWLEKAQRNMKPGAQNNIEAEKQVDYSEYINEPGFFDSIIINDNLDSAYEKLKEVVMQYYWQKYEEEDSLED